MYLVVSELFCILYKSMSGVVFWVTAVIWLPALSALVLIASRQSNDEVPPLTAIPLIKNSKGNFAAKKTKMRISDLPAK